MRTSADANMRNPSRQLLVGTLAASCTVYYVMHWVRCTIDAEVCRADERMFLSSFVEHSSQITAPTCVFGTIFLGALRVCLSVTQSDLGISQHGHWSVYLNVAIGLILLTLCVPTAGNLVYAIAHILPLLTGTGMVVVWYGVWISRCPHRGRWLWALLGAYAGIVLSTVTTGVVMLPGVPSPNWMPVIAQSTGLFSLLALNVIALSAPLARTCAREDLSIWTDTRTLV